MARIMVKFLVLVSSVVSFASVCNEIDDFQAHALSEISHFDGKVEASNLKLVSTIRVNNVVHNPNELDRYIQLSFYDIVDLVDSKDSEIAHIEKALGKPFWAINNYTATYRMTDTESLLAPEHSFYSVGYGQVMLSGQLKTQLKPLMPSINVDGPSRD